ncbi:MAG: alpha/beta fold hydrolase, partial [Limisphaerales bacterium]
FVYRKLSELLGPDQPSYGLVTPPEPFTSIELMAAHYISELKTIQPSGPYHVGGYCFGGVIAFEMARQLEMQGDKVALLALIDSAPPNMQRESRLSPALAAHFVRTFPSWVSSQLEDGIAPLCLRMLRRAKAALDKRFARRQAGDGNEAASGVNELRERINRVIDFTNYPEHYKRYAEVHWAALDCYKPQILPGRITLFRTARPRLFEFEAERFWSKLATGGVDVQIVPGTHEKVLESPNVEVLASEMRARLGIPREVDAIRSQHGSLARRKAA